MGLSALASVKVTQFWLRKSLDRVSKWNGGGIYKVLS